ncbi:MAG: hypothetical protein GX241_00515 [Ruminococcaceae bacterium]|nr:hypothetical protein [Oscillospiraceae bacterium]
MKKFIAFALTLVMCICLIPISAIAEDPTTVFVTLTVKGDFAVTKNSKLVAQLPIEVTDVCDANGDPGQDGKLTIDDALHILHEDYAPAGKGYASNGNFMFELWGDTSGSFGYLVNNVFAWSTNDVVSDGDQLYAYIYVDEVNFSDSYSYFDVVTANIPPYTSIDFLLKNISGYEPPPSYAPIISETKGAQLALVGEDGKLVPTGQFTGDGNNYTTPGVASILFSTEGTYYVSAVSGDPTNEILVPPIAVVTVKNGAKTEINYADDTKFELTTTKPADTFDNIYKAVGKYMNDSIKDTPESGIEDVIMPLARAGYKYSDDYLKKYVADILKNKKPEDSRSALVFALTSLGFDASNVEGRNYLTPFMKLADIKALWITSEAYALLAIDTNDYWDEIKAAGGDATADEIVKDILSKQVTNGGWGFDGTNMDIDTTAMVIQSLAPYYKTNLEVKTAVDKALKLLSNAQASNGAYLNWGSENTATTAQVILAVCSLGIDPATDPRFVKTEGSLLDALLRAYVKGAGFAMTPGGPSEDSFGTPQGFQALNAYYRLKNNKRTFFDMRDVFEKTPEAPAETVAATADNSEIVATLMLMASSAFAMYAVRKKEDES